MQVYSKGTVNYIDFIKPQVHTAPTSRCRLFVLDTALQPSVREEVESSCRRARQAILVRSRAYIETVAKSPVLYLEY